MNMWALLSCASGDEPSRESEAVFKRGWLSGERFTGSAEYLFSSSPQQTGLFVHCAVHLSQSPRRAVLLPKFNSGWWKFWKHEARLAAPTSIQVIDSSPHRRLLASAFRAEQRPIKKRCQLHICPFTTSSKYWKYICQKTNAEHNCRTSALSKERSPEPPLGTY